MSLQAPSALAIDARGLRFGIAAARFNAGYVDAADRVRSQHADAGLDAERTDEPVADDARADHRW